MLAYQRVPTIRILPSQWGPRNPLLGPLLQQASLRAALHWDADALGASWDREFLRRSGSRNWVFFTTSGVLTLWTNKFGNSHRKNWRFHKRNGRSRQEFWICHQEKRENPSKSRSEPKPLNGMSPKIAGPSSGKSGNLTTDCRKHWLSDFWLAKWQVLAVATEWGNLYINSEAALENRHLLHPSWAQMAFLHFQKQQNPTSLSPRV